MAKYDFENAFLSFEFGLHYAQIKLVNGRCTAKRIAQMSEILQTLVVLGQAVEANGNYAAG